MKKNILALGMAAVLALSLMTGRTGTQKDDNTPPAGEYTGGPAW